DFFFQAEDGIRYYKVTGVQTCALPICGKSVLLKHLIGLMRPNAGEIWIEGQNIIDMSERQLASIRQKVGILFQGSALFDSMTVRSEERRVGKEGGMGWHRAVCLIALTI